MGKSPVRVIGFSVMTRQGQAHQEGKAMLRIALVYGIISGTVTIVTMMLGILTNDSGSFFSGEVFGYLVMLIALSMIFIGIKRYRDTELGGVIKFLPALGLGLSIAAIAGVIYVAVWEIYSYNTNYAFIREYTAGVIESAKAKDIGQSELQRVVAEMEGLSDSYAKPYFRLPMTFLEIFPVGLIIAIISAALLQNPKILPARQ
ncbi:MAG: DUF4199 domain-containing protein [Parasphingorhabdus sp.]